MARRVRRERTGLDVSHQAVNGVRLERLAEQLALRP